MTCLWVQACAAGPAALILRDSGQDIAPLFARLAGALHALSWRPAGVLLTTAAAAVSSLTATALLQRSLLAGLGSAITICSGNCLLARRLCTGMMTSPL